MRPMNSRWIKNASTLKDQRGFTLVEIIAVLVILGILAVVAVPKYFDLQTQAQDRAMQAAMAEAIGRVNGYFAQELLDGESWGDIEYTTDTIGDNLGEDFDLEVNDNNDNTITLTVSPTEGSGLSGVDPLERTIDKPGSPPTTTTTPSSG